MEGRSRVNTIDGLELIKSGQLRQETINNDTNQYLGHLYRQLGPAANEGIGQALIEYSRTMGSGSTKDSSIVKSRAALERTLKPLNQWADKQRNKYLSDAHFKASQDSDLGFTALQKANIDVGTLTNFANITGGQSLGYVSLDTRMARSTIRPNSFTLYQCLEKSLAWQVVDYWSQATSTGGAPPGGAFAGFSSVTSGSLNTNAGQYVLNSIVLKLAVDGRAITTALASQNSYVNVSEQENVNAALSVLTTINWANYWGDATLFPNQYNGIAKTVSTASTVANTSGINNIFDFQSYSNSVSASTGWSKELQLYNLIYQAASDITSYGTFGRITHAFMSPTAMGSFQGLTVAQLNNVVSQISELQDRAPLVVNGNLLGMQTRVGHIQFPQDLLIDARNIPLQATNPSQATSVGPTAPTSVTAVVTGATTSAGSEFVGQYVGTGANYFYAVASMNANFTESNVTYTSGATSITTAGNALQLTITRPGANDATAYRVYRAGQGYSPTLSPGGLQDPLQYRYVGTVADSGSSTTTFVDLNGGGTTSLPGSTTIFLLDMDPVDLAIDYRVLLPLVRVELFANNLFMPWAVAMIGAIRLRVPQFHGYIKNYFPTNPEWNPLVSLNAG